MKLGNKWYSAREKPPKKGRYLAVCRQFRSAVVRYYENGKWHSWQEVLYWQPLPKIPKEMKNENTKET